MLLNVILLSISAAIYPGPNVIRIFYHSLNNQKNTAYSYLFGVILGVLIWLIIVSFGISNLTNFVSNKYIHLSYSIFLLLSALFLIKINFTKQKNLKIESDDNKILNTQVGLLSSILNIEIPFFYIGIFLKIIEYYQPKYTNFVALKYSGLFTFIESIIFILVIKFASLISKLPKKFIKILNFITVFAFLYFALISFNDFLR